MLILPGTVLLSAWASVEISVSCLQLSQPVFIALLAFAHLFCSVVLLSKFPCHNNICFLSTSPSSFIAIFYLNFSLCPFHVCTCICSNQHEGAVCTTKLIVAELVDSPANLWDHKYGKARRWIRSWATLIQSQPPQLFLIHMVLG